MSKHTLGLDLNTLLPCRDQKLHDSVVTELDNKTQLRHPCDRFLVQTPILMTIQHTAWHTHYKCNETTERTWKRCNRQTTNSAVHTRCTWYSHTQLSTRQIYCHNDTSSSPLSSIPKATQTKRLPKTREPHSHNTNIKCLHVLKTRTLRLPDQRWSSMRYIYVACAAKVFDELGFMSTNFFSRKNLP